MQNLKRVLSLNCKVREELDPLIFSIGFQMLKIYFCHITLNTFKI